MLLQPRTCCWLLALTLCTGGLAAQNESRGIFPGVPAALSLADGPGTSGAAMLRKGHGFLQAPPPAWPAGGPIRDLEAILRSCGGSGIDVDALSMGQDWILADDNTGRIVVPPNRWAAITFSVSRASQGAAGSRIRAETTGGSAGADVFSWILPGSAVPAPLADRVERAQDSAEIDLSGVANAELDALDHFLPIYDLEAGMQALMPQPPTIFFSVTDATKGQVPSGWWAGTPPSGATILQTTLQPTGAWSCPTPFMTFRDLRLLAPGEDVDALAIDLADQRLLFSTKSANRDQIQFLYFGTDSGVPMTYEDQNGTPVSTKIGLLQNDDVDAICAMDPALRPTGAPNAFHFYVGTPRPGLQPRPAFLEPTPSLSASAFRNHVGGMTKIDTWMVGWPASGQGPGIAALFLTWEDSQAPMFNLGPIYVRNHQNPTFAGDPQHYRLDVPPNWSLIDVRVTLRWFALGTGAMQAAEAWPIRAEL